MINAADKKEARPEDRLGGVQRKSIHSAECLLGRTGEVTRERLPGANIEAEILNCITDDHGHGPADCTAAAEPTPWAVPNGNGPKAPPGRMLRFGTSLFYERQMTIA
jgi:hypothetical protein